MKIYNFEQRSNEWRKIRAGKFTASNFHICFGVSETKKTFLYKIAHEIITGQLIENNYTNSDMQRGVENESVAVAGYELTTNNKVESIGFCELDEMIGCSPDGFVDKDGMIEIKCPNETCFLKQVIKDKIKPEYYTQIQFNLYVTSRQWCDYVAYNENYNLFIKRFKRDEEYIQKIKGCLDECIKEVKSIVEQYKLKIAS